MSDTFQAGAARRAVGTARRNAIAFAALFVALSGTAYAANEVTSSDIAKKAVKSKNIAKKAVGAQHIRKNAIRTRHVRKNAIRTRQVKDGSLRTGDVRGLDKSLKNLSDGQVVVGGYIGSLLSEVDSLKARVSDLEANQIAVQKSIDDLEAGLAAVETGLGVVESDFAAFATASDSRLDSLCAEADSNNQETRDLKDALNIGAITTLGVDLSGVSLPDYDPAECQG